MGAVKYFNAGAYFMSKRLTQDFGLNLSQGLAGAAEMTAEERQTLEEAIQQADTGSKQGNITAVYHLISLVEEMAKRYGISGVWEHHGKSLKDFLDDITQRPEIVKHYGLEQYVRQMQQKQESAPTAQGRPEKNTRCLQG